MHGGIDRGPRTHTASRVAYSDVLRFQPDPGRVKHRPARYETKVGTSISSKFRSKHRAQRRLQLWFLEKRKRSERNRGSQKHFKNIVELFKIAFRVGESTRFLE